jgi:hypothetical protein
MSKNRLYMNRSSRCAKCGVVGKLIVLAFLLQAPLLAESQIGCTPDNQVFQFVQSGTCTAWSDGSTNNAKAYLWIPEACERLRGLLILCANVPEHRLVSHPAIRKVCSKNNLGIVWCPQSFMNFARQKPGFKKMANENATTVAFLQQLLDGLAKSSGYEEVATVPWLPMGESGHLLMVDALVETMPQRCIAGIWIKNSHLPPTNRQVPALVAFGTAQEWSQDKTDIRTAWNNIAGTYDTILKQRQSNPKWPLSYIIDGGSGHFDCSDRLTAYFANYIEAASKARLSEDGTPALKPIRIENGFVADLPVPGHEGQPVKPASANDALPWFFDKAMAQEAQAIAAINWKAETQLPGCLDDDGKVLPFNFNGIVDMRPTKMEADGITFTLQGKMLERIPTNFVAAGERLATTPGVPTAEWLCGNVVPLGANRFRIAPGRAAGTVYLALRKEGTDAIRSVVQPIHLELHQMRNAEGKAQTITFNAIPDVKAGTVSIPLQAKSDAGLPVSYYVDAGPAIILDNKLVFTKIPPRSHFPIEVTVVAWQWGQATEPKVKTANPVKQTFKIGAP